MLIRYADDFVVLCATRARAEEAQDRAAAVLAGLGLRLNPDKTRIVRLTKGEEGFDFLGFHHAKVEAWRWPGRFYMQRWPSKRAMASIRDKVRQATDRRFVGYSLETAVQRLNPVLRGWGNYFRSRELRSEVQRRRQLRPHAAGQTGQHQVRAVAPELGSHQPLQPGVAGEPRGVSPHGDGAAGDGACAAVNGVGKPCAGEPHARFDRGPLAKRERDRPRWARKRYAERPTSVNERSASGLPHRPEGLSVWACQGARNGNPEWVNR